MSSPMGSVDATVVLEADGETLTGSFDIGGGRVWPVKDGTIKGNAIAGAATAMGNTVDWSMARAK